MINPDLDPRVLSERYRTAEPFPHAVIDHFLDDAVANRVAAELEAVDMESWYRDDIEHQVEKRWMDNPDALPEATAAVLRYMNSPAAIAFFETLTGIKGLLPDPGYLGGGVHVTGRGGKLQVHADLNIHPETGHHRRLDALLFLNRDWNPSWHGELELWPEDLSAPSRIISPEQNRLAVFTITDTAFHGVPNPLQCPPQRKRLSLALYYYSVDRPEDEKSPFHMANWQKVAGVQ